MPPAAPGPIPLAMATTSPSWTSVPALTPWPPRLLEHHGIAAVRHTDDGRPGSPSRRPKGGETRWDRRSTTAGPRERPSGSPAATAPAGSFSARTPSPRSGTPPTPAACCAGSDGAPERPHRISINAGLTCNRRAIVGPCRSLQAILRRPTDGPAAPSLTYAIAILVTGSPSLLLRVARARIRGCPPPLRSRSASLQGHLLPKAITANALRVVRSWSRRVHSHPWSRLRPCSEVVVPTDGPVRPQCASGPVTVALQVRSLPVKAAAVCWPDRRAATRVYAPVRCR